MGGGVGDRSARQDDARARRRRRSACGSRDRGRNKRLERRVTAAAERTAYPLRVFGFVDNVFDYMHASDVLLTKPGGLTSSEALAAQVPMILVKPLPGQEERNTRYLVARRAAVRARGERN
jgi:processive 1,2-diacylglycerol beta-glucosyltransferase